MITIEIHFNQGSLPVPGSDLNIIGFKTVFSSKYNMLPGLSVLRRRVEAFITLTNYKLMVFHFARDFLV